MTARKNRESSPQKNARGPEKRSGAPEPVQPLATQEFYFTAPTAHSVLLAGDFTQWDKKPIPLQREQGGSWHTKVDLEPGLHRYRFLVDGRWRDDPECSLRIPNPYGTEDAVLQVATPQV